MKKRIGLLVLAASLMVSQTALAGKWTGTVPTQTRADWAAEYDTPTVGPAATRITADLLDQPNGNALMTYFQSVRVQVLDAEGDWVKVRVGDADSGSLTGYAGGIDKKVKLLELERTDMRGFFIPAMGTAL